VIFDRKGGPALYVRGDEWDTATTMLPEPLRSRLVRFWPGADAEPREYVPWYLRSQSEWLHEREWRVAGELRFDWSEVAFLILPHTEPDYQVAYASWLAEVGRTEESALFASRPCVVMTHDGQVIRDSTGIWT
jgi:hypothetical protein